VLITDDEEHAADFAEKTWGKTKVGEEKMKEKHEEEEKKKRDEEDKKRKEGRCSRVYGTGVKREGFGRENERNK